MIYKSFNEHKAHEICTAKSYVDDVKNAINENA